MAQDRQCPCRAAESAHPGAKKAVAEIYHAEHKQQAMKAAKAFAADYGAKRPKAAAKITDHLDVLLAFYDFPAKGCICAPRTRSSKADQDFGQLCVFSASSTSPDSSGYQGWGHDLAIALAAGWGLLGRYRAAGPRGRQVRGSGLIGVVADSGCGARPRSPPPHRASHRSAYRALCVKSIRSTDLPLPTRTVATISGGNRPCSTTPGVEANQAASAAGSVTGPW